jgi:hypothetical protein
MRTRDAFLEMLSPALVRARRERRPRAGSPVRRVPCPEPVAASSLIGRLR